MTIFDQDSLRTEIYKIQKKKSRSIKQSNKDESVQIKMKATKLTHSSASQDTFYVSYS